MTSTKTKNVQAEAPKPALDLASLAGDPEEVEFTTATKDVPQEIKDFVDRGYELWKTSPKKFWGRTLSSEAAVSEVKKLAGIYAKSVNRTFRTKSVEDGKRLVYKVTDAVRKNGKGKADDDAS